MKQTALTLPAAVIVERQIDDMLASSFPASDPPSWTLGGAATNPADHALRIGASVARARTLNDGGAGSTADASTRRSGVRALASLLGAVGLALMVPVFVVLLPLALIYRLMLEISGWPNWLRGNETDFGRPKRSQDASSRPSPALADNLA